MPNSDSKPPRYSSLREWFSSTCLPFLLQVLMGTIVLAIVLSPYYLSESVFDSAYMAVTILIAGWFVFCAVYHLCRVIVEHVLLRLRHRCSKGEPPPDLPTLVVPDHLRTAPVPSSKQPMSLNGLSQFVAAICGFSAYGCIMVEWQDGIRIVSLPTVVVLIAFACFAGYVASRSRGL